MNCILKKISVTVICVSVFALTGCTRASNTNESFETNVPIASADTGITFHIEDLYQLDSSATLDDLLNQIKATDGSNKSIKVYLKDTNTNLPTPGKRKFISIYAEDALGNRKDEIIQVEVLDKKDESKSDVESKVTPSTDSQKDNKSIKENNVHSQEVVKNVQEKQDTQKGDSRSDTPKESNSQKSDTPESKESRLKKAQEQYDKGSLGFFEENESNQALQIIKDAQALNTTTQVGAYGDATNLENMKRVFQYMRRTNYCRSIDTNNSGENKNALLVTDEMMALSQVQANYSYNVLEHWNALKGRDKYYYVAENISWGYSDGNDGWFNEEKANFEAYMLEHPSATQDEIEAWDENNIQNGISNKQVGHYLTLVNPFDASERRINVFGYAIVTKAGTYGKIEHCSNYGSTNWGLGPNYPSVGQTYSVNEYEAKFLAYYNRVINELNEAKKAMY